jgi:hypothetical protein
MSESTDSDDAVDTAELRPGTEVGGYVIDAKIGVGGMGVVYGARHPRIGKRVAIKVLAPMYSANASTVRRFEQEAKVVNEIRHPNIVDVFQFGELPDGRSYFVMEWLDGQPLSERVERGPLSAQDTIAILDVVSDALEAAHEHGVIHRDLKADNVFLVRGRNRATVKLLDFGLAKLAGKSDTASVHRTRSGVIVGTPAYMAPEQARAKMIDARTDVYALGVLAYKMLTGAMPFTADNAMDLIVMHLKAPPPSPSKLARETPPELSKLVVRMMAKEPDERPALAEVRKVFAQLRQARVSAAQVPPAARRATSVLTAMMMFLAGVIALGAIWLVQRNVDDDRAAKTRADEPTLTVSATEVGGEPPKTETAAPPASAGTPAPVDIGSLAEHGFGDDEMIEFDPDPIARGSGSAVRRRRPTAEPATVVPSAIPAIRPGSLILVLESASAIEIDGIAVAQSSKGGRFDVAPGSHEIRIKAPGRQPVVRTFEVESGGTAVIRIADDVGSTGPDAP